MPSLDCSWSKRSFCRAQDCQGLTCRDLQRSFFCHVLHRIVQALWGAYLYYLAWLYYNSSTQAWTKMMHYQFVLSSPMSARNTLKDLSQFCRRSVTPINWRNLTLPAQITVMVLLDILLRQSIAQGARGSSKHYLSSLSALYSVTCMSLWRSPLWESGLS